MGTCRGMQSVQTRRSATARLAMNMLVTLIGRKCMTMVSSTNTFPTKYQHVLYNTQARSLQKIKETTVFIFFTAQFSILTSYD